MEFKNYISKLGKRIELMQSLFGLEELEISYDVLSDKKKKTKRELLYFNLGNKEEESGAFIFGFDFFTKELSEQDFKKHLCSNALTYKIYNAYHKLKKTHKKVKITDIVNFLQNDRKDSGKVDEILSRILTLAYYFNWNLKKDPKDIEGDSFIEFEDRFLLKVKQRFNFDIMTSVYENQDIFIFINARAKINIVFKEQDEFTKSDIEAKVIPPLKKVFDIKNVKIR